MIKYGVILLFMFLGFLSWKIIEVRAEKLVENIIENKRTRQIISVGALLCFFLVSVILGNMTFQSVLAEMLGIESEGADLGDDKYVIVPNLINLSLDTATSALEDIDLYVGEVIYEFSSDYTPGVVMSQITDRGTRVERGDSINLVVSALSMDDGSTQEESLVEGVNDSKDTEVINTSDNNSVEVPETKDDSINVESDISGTVNLESNSLDGNVNEKSQEDTDLVQTEETDTANRYLADINYFNKRVEYRDAYINNVENFTANDGWEYGLGVVFSIQRGSYSGATSFYFEQSYVINGDFDRFQGIFALSYNTRDSQYAEGSLVIYGDGEELYSSEEKMAPGVLPQTIDIDVSGIKVIEFKVVNHKSAKMGDGMYVDFGLVDAVFSKDDSGEKEVKEEVQEEKDFDQVLSNMTYMVQEVEYRDANIYEIEDFQANDGTNLGQGISFSISRSAYSGATFFSFKRTYAIKGEYQRFQGTFSLSYNTRDSEYASGVLVVLGDDKELYRSNQGIKAGMLPEFVDIDVTGVNLLEIQVFNAKQAEMGKAMVVNFGLVDAGFIEEYVAVEEEGLALEETYDYLTLMNTFGSEFYIFENNRTDDYNDRKTYFVNTWTNGNRFNVGSNYVLGYGIDFEGGTDSQDTVEFFIDNSNLTYNEFNFKIDFDIFADNCLDSFIHLEVYKASSLKPAVVDYSKLYWELEISKEDDIMEVSIPIGGMKYLCLRIDRAYDSGRKTSDINYPVLIDPKLN